MGHLLRTRGPLIHDNLPHIQQLARAVSSCHHQEQPNTIEVARVTETLVRVITRHFSAEAHTLFPAIRGIEQAYVGESPGKGRPGSVRRVVAQMAQEHDGIGHLLSKVQELIAGYNATGTGCDPYRQLCEKLTDIDRELHLEVHLENNILFNRVLRISAALYG